MISMVVLNQLSISDRRYDGQFYNRLAMRRALGFKILTLAFLISAHIKH